MLAVDVIVEGPSLWATVGVALGSALLGGFLATAGGRWATRRDLVERNRHALLMEDLPEYRNALANVDRLWDAGEPDAVVQGAKERLVESMLQIFVRTRILSTRERQLGWAVLHEEGLDHRHDLIEDLFDVSSTHTATWRHRAIDALLRRTGPVKVLPRPDGGPGTPTGPPTTPAPSTPSAAGPPDLDPPPRL